MNKFLDFARNYKIQFVCVLVWYIYDDIAAKINLIWLVCDFRREVVLVAKLKHHAVTLTCATRKQIECEKEVKQDKIIIFVWYMLGIN